MKSFLFSLFAVVPLFSTFDLPEEDGFCPPEFYAVAVDTYMSPETGAIDLYSAFRIYEAIDNYTVKNWLYDMPSWYGKTLRLLDIVLIDMPIAETTMVLQHEVFGHGAFLRKAGISASYDINVPTPYGKGGGATSFSSEKFAQLPPYQQSLITTGGVEATYRLSNDIALYRLKRGGYFPVQEAILHMMAVSDLTFYALGLQTDDFFEDEGNDMAAYVDHINHYYGKNVLSRSELKTSVLLNLVDLLYLNDWSTMWGYFWDGDLCDRPWGFYLCGAKIIPALRVWLAPYGLEYGVGSYVGWGDVWSFVSIKGGSTAGHGSFSVGIDTPYLFYDGPWIFGFKADMWLQPSFEQNGNDAHTRFGARGAACVSYKLEAPFLLTGELSVKSRGYVPGLVGQSNVNFLFGLSYICE